MRFLTELPEQLDGSGGGENRFLLEMRQILSKNVDMRFLFEKNYTNETSIALGYYFQATSYLPTTTYTAVSQRLLACRELLLLQVLAVVVLVFS